MSAIYGIISKREKPVEQASINKIKQAMAHRVTDGDGIKQSKNVVFGFCKLTVYPQQQNEQLPIETSDLIFTANARIDNRDELYSLLSLDKKQWGTEADSFLILKAYQHWGAQCVEHLQGEFVFAVWDKIRQQLFLATDQVGFRPLYYYDAPEVFIFCSEIKGVEAAKGTPHYFNDEHIINYHFRQSNSEQTYNKEVFALCGGIKLSMVNNTIKKEKYWALQPAGRYNFKNDEEWINCLRDLMYKAVSKRLNPEVPVGITLSGGLDSSSVACILSELLAKKNKPLYAFSSVLPVGHGGIEEDERRYIDIVNKHCPNIIQTFVEAPGVGPLDNLAKAFDINEAIPNVFFYMDMAIAEAAKEKNIRSLFTGFGGDFWVSWKGNSIIYLLMQQGKYKASMQLLKQLAKVYDINPLKLLKSDYLFYTTLWHQLRKIKPRDINWQQHTTLQPGFAAQYTHVLFSEQQSSQSAAMQAMVSDGQISRFNGLFANRNEHYNMATCDMMFDKDIMEFLIEAPVHLFNKNGYRRSLIRHAMHDILPPAIQWRRDKSPYSPDYAKRTIMAKAKLFSMMDDPEKAFVFDKYISKDAIIRHFDDIVPFAGFSSPTSVTGIRIMQAGIVTDCLIYLKSKGYLFE
ncbi:hypothetical protein KXQ82_09800 [Mucilaginibacter sp. HMF5004]|uniref:asparagine synthase-related protein n=1 Tax=Mucilaginibacter rivuli TaxID=2857527 RepID=UPI001C5E875B|nr:asparagine synthase-related protein [Mucilaginibacter rivuli]MBW4890011.1 hypothetical protein [Mucilaginibacter rivuli]